MQQTIRLNMFRASGLDIVYYFFVWSWISKEVILPNIASKPINMNFPIARIVLKRLKQFRAVHRFKYKMKYKQELIEFVVREGPYHPVLFFIQLVITHLISPLAFSNSLLVIALICTLVTRVNYFWYVGIMISPGQGPLALINILFGALSLNEPWKVTVFIYVMGDIYFLDNNQVNLLYNVVALMTLLYHFYDDLPFGSIQNNKLYFAGFTGFWVLEIMRYVELSLGIQISSDTIGILLAGVSVFSGYYLICRRVDQIINSPLEDLHNINQFAVYIEWFRKKLELPLEKVGIERAHKKKCVDMECFCKKTDKIPFDKLLVRHLYSQWVTKLRNTPYDKSTEQYVIDNLIQQGQFPLALESYIKYKSSPTDIFKFIHRKRVEARLQNQLRKVENEYVVKMVFENAFDYEVNYEVFKRDILEVIDLKIKFWKQVNKSVSKLISLRKLGEQILVKFNKMYDFYNSLISPLEKEIFVFYGSIIYNLFMLVATNYKDLAEGNIKSIKKSNQNTASDSKKDTKSFYIKVSIVKETFAQIQNFTSNFLKLIKSSLPKSEYVGHSMEFLIPKCYVKEHLRGMRELRQYNINNLLGVDVNPIFFMDNYNKIVPCNVVVKYSVNILNQLSIIANVKQLNNDSDWILFNVEGQVQYITTDKIDMAIPYFPQIQQVVAHFKQKWSSVTIPQQVYFPIQTAKVQLKSNDVYYTCHINSPLSTSFRYPTPPPIHLRIHNESHTYFQDQQLIHDPDVMGCMKKINNIIDQAETESQGTHTTADKQVIDIIKRIENIPSLPFFNCFFMIMLSLSVLALTCSWLSYSLFNPSWAENRTQRGNHYELLLSVYDIEMFITRVMSKSMSLYAIDSNLVTNADYSSAYADHDYQGESYDQIDNMCHQLKKLVSYDIREEDDQIGDHYIEAISKHVNVVTPRSNHTLTVMSLISHSVSCCLQLASKHKFTDVILSQIYWASIYANLCAVVDSVKASLNQQLDTLMQNNIILVILLELLLLVGLPPIYASNRLINHQQNYIFELIVSTQSELINRDVQSLIDLAMSLKYNSTNNVSRMTMDEKNHKFEVCSDQNSYDIGSDAKRKRNGELDMTGFSRKGVLLYVCILVYSVIILGFFLAKKGEIEYIKKNMADQIQTREWRNDRLLLQVNLKKWIYNYQPGELINGTALDAWIRMAIMKRKTNYVSTDLLSNISFNCTNPIICSPKSNLATELSLNMYGQTLMAEAFIDKNIAKIALSERIEEICSWIIDTRRQASSDSLFESISLFVTIKSTMFSVAIIVFVSSFIASILYVLNLKESYITATRMITLLDDQMIKKNKRVESYLQRLSKLQ